MRKVNFLLLTIGLIFLSFNQASAQLTSQHAVGARFGSATGFNYRYTLAEDRAIEGILSIQSNSTSRRFRMVGLYQYHKPLTPEFSWYYGFGGSVGSFKYKDVHNDSAELALSIDGVIGVEYNVPNAPLAISLDLKPYFDFIQSSSLKIIDPFGLSIRYKF